jgi:hypothetical protein
MTACPAGPHAGLTGHEPLQPGLAGAAASEVAPHSLAAGPSRVTAGEVGSQRGDAPPLDLAAELHVQSDRMTIAYRRQLAALGLSEDYSA